MVGTTPVSLLLGQDEYRVCGLKTGQSLFIDLSLVRFVYSGPLPRTTIPSFRRGPEVSDWRLTSTHGDPVHEFVGGDGVGEVDVLLLLLLGEKELFRPTLLLYYANYVSQSDRVS